jgi:hypothetical protein
MMRLLLLAAFMIPLTAPVLAESLNQKIAGTWILKEGREEFQDHTRTPWMAGKIMFDPNGHFAMFLIGRDRAKPPTGDPRAPIGPLVAYYGNFKTDEANGAVLYNIEYGSTPLLDGTKGRVWTITFNGDVMKVTTKTLQTPEGPMTPVNEWTRE